VWSVLFIQATPGHHMEAILSCVTNERAAASATGRPAQGGRAVVKLRNSRLFPARQKFARWRKAQSLITCARQLPSKRVENGNEWERRWLRTSAIPCLFPLNGSAADRWRVLPQGRDSEIETKTDAARRTRISLSRIIPRVTRVAICCGARHPRTVCASQAVMRAEKVYLLPRFPRWICCENIGVGLACSCGMTAVSF
jgi:hypothetical protein